MVKVIWSIKEIVEILKQRQDNQFDGNIAVSGARGDGKCQKKGDKVLMSDGLFKNVEDVKVGDEIISPQSNGSYIFVKVINTHSHFEKEVYEVREQTRNHKLLYTCSGEHLIPVMKPHSKRMGRGDSIPRFHYKLLENLSAKRLSGLSNKGSHLVSFSTTAIQSSNLKKPSIDPYSLGAFLGDGSYGKSNFSITTDDLEIFEYFNKKYKIIRSTPKKGHTVKSYHFSKLSKLGLTLKKLNLYGKTSGDKFIPKEYLNYSIKNRFELLAGLIDTDGFISKNNQITICTKSFQLAEDIKNLVFTLGGYSLIRPIYKACQSFKEKRKYYDVSIQFDNPLKIPLKLKRRKDRLRKVAHNPRNIAIKCIKTKSQVVYGIEIDSPSKWYVTNNWMITHNSSLIGKIFYRFSNFDPWKHQVYSREKVIELLKTQMRGICWDDEAINTGYKREFQNKGQQELIKHITAYRDNFNIFASAIPNFFSLDKDLRDLYFIHFHVIERGIAVVHMPSQGRLYSPDKWDADHNKKIEAKWAKVIKKNIKFKPPYYQLSTFRGYLYFEDLTTKQRKLYEEIKKTKRGEAFQTANNNAGPIKLTLTQKLFNRLKEGKLTEDFLLQSCLMEGERYSSVRTNLNQMVKDAGMKGTLKDVIRASNPDDIHSNYRGQKVNQIPSY